MGYSIIGKAIDPDKNPVEFAIVFVSDANGKPKTPAINTQTDEKGAWSLGGVTDDDFITIRQVGLQPKTFAAKSVIPIELPVPGSIPQRMIQTQLQPDAATTLQEVQIVAQKPTTNARKKSSGAAIAAFIFAGLVIGTVIIFLIGRDKGNQTAAAPAAA